MSDTESKPVLFMKKGCPFCLKVRLFLLESGLLPNVEVREGASPAEEQALRDELSPHVGKVSFPAAKFGADDYVVGSDEIIERLAKEAAVASGDLPTLTAYVDGPFRTLLELHRENAELKKQAG